MFKFILSILELAVYASIGIVSLAVIVCLIVIPVAYNRESTKICESNFNIDYE